jgi:hypothetical protein
VCPHLAAAFAGITEVCLPFWQALTASCQVHCIAACVNSLRGRVGREGGYARHGSSHYELMIDLCCGVGGYSQQIAVASESRDRSSLALSQESDDCFCTTCLSAAAKQSLQDATICG